MSDGWVEEDRGCMFRLVEQSLNSILDHVFATHRPTMLKSFDRFELNGSGEFFKLAMHRPPAPEAGERGD